MERLVGEGQGRRCVCGQVMIPAGYSRVGDGDMVHAVDGPCHVGPESELAHNPATDMLIEWGGEENQTTIRCKVCGASDWFAGVCSITFCEAQFLKLRHGEPLDVKAPSLEDQRRMLIELGVLPNPDQYAVLGYHGAQYSDPRVQLLINALSQLANDHMNMSRNYDDMLDDRNKIDRVARKRVRVIQWLRDTGFPHNDHDAPLLDEVVAYGLSEEG